MPVPRRSDHRIPDRSRGEPATVTLAVGVHERLIMRATKVS